jgi:G6PDH family F420-dependent oxidoreductase
MKSIGYALSSEEHKPSALVANAVLAEKAGFGFAMISDHYHPWTTRQGQSGFVWAVLGAIAAQTRRLRLGTGVTCPILRFHPALVAQAAATTAQLSGGRFFLGLGAGENLNEHIFGAAWPRVEERHARLREAIDIIRGLWTGKEYSHSGPYFVVDEARIYSLPDTLPDIYVAGTGASSAKLAADCADGFIGLKPDAGLLRAFRGTRGRKPAIAQLSVCWARSEKAARETVKTWWPQTGLGGDLSWELKTPALVESACEGLTDERLADIPCGPDPDVHLEAIRKFAKAGYEHVYIHQIGPDQKGFFRFFREKLRRKLG